jgi:hypothetical protein
MKTKIIIGLFLMVLISSCRKVDTPQPINLGVTSESTKIDRVSPIISNGNSITVWMSTTIGSKYSLSVTDLLGNELLSVGFTAEGIITQKKLDLSNLKNGDYNIVLTDIKGREFKINIIIKK